MALSLNYYIATNLNEFGVILFTLTVTHAINLSEFEVIFFTLHPTSHV